MGVESKAYTQEQFYEILKHHMDHGATFFEALRLIERQGKSAESEAPILQANQESRHSNASAS